ncbi:MAG: hypothetical protein L0Y67_03840 [Gammaproteobacteria bacterium]|nr:hypothetical protein [Gammaproteobacteria bacterium]MCI0590726.1 hypothetical protein [Gammaproteobacteria bacterium]
MQRPDWNVLAGAAFMLSLLICLGAYWKGLQGPLVLDDVPHLAPLYSGKLTRENWAAYLFDSSGPLKRPVAMATFLLNAMTSGDAIPRWKHTNLMIHLLTGLVVFWLSACLFSVREGRDDAPHWLAGAAVSTMWLLHPLHVSTVLYTVQRMTELSALFTFAGLLSYVLGRKAQIAGRPGGLPITLAFFVFAPLAVFSKENAVLFPCYLILLEVFLFRFKILQPTSFLNKTTLAVVLAAPVTVAGLYLALNLDDLVLRGYVMREFTLTERLLTELRVLVIYLYQLLIPLQQNMGFVHDDIVLSKGWLTPPTTLLSLITIIGLVWFAWVMRRRNPLVSFGIMFFFCAHLLESTILPLEIMFEHRNYLPSYGFLVAVVALVMQFGINRRAASALAVLTVAVLAFVTLLRATTWASEGTLYTEMMRVHPRSQRLATVLARLLTDAARYSEAKVVLAPHHSPGARLQGVYIACREAGALTEGVLLGLRDKLNPPIDNYAVIGLIDLANLGLDGKCEFPPDEYLALLTKALALPIQGKSNRLKLLVYKAHYLWLLKRPNEAIATLDEGHKLVTDDPIPLFLASEWLIELGDTERASAYYARATAVSRNSLMDYTPFMERIGKRIAEARGGSNAGAVLQESSGN